MQVKENYTGLKAHANSGPNHWILVLLVIKSLQKQMTNRCGGTRGGPWFHAVMRLQECERPHMELLCHHQENSIAFCKEIMQQRGISICKLRLIAAEE